ncbi:tRNA lysidine(34) synthetase TilS [Corynebacterium sp.]|uniref:tRNA lysidine(34) synthetase TilS n=1 Tax=Corynebacterium sp. TaxID=1720 RepID=UPI0026DC2D7C|nr:tRNA lysidine(34) synthetase TilS [Corynebacterium sp.]
MANSTESARRKRVEPFWPEPSPHFVKVRNAVKAALRSVDVTHGVVIGLSGGADSLALVAATCAEAVSPRGLLYSLGQERELGQGSGARPLSPVHAVVIDHGLQEGSDEVAKQAVAKVKKLGASAEVIKVDIDEDDPAGPEASARLHRHEALRAVAAKRKAPLLLAHTLDDQAETVILRLARGGGPQALSAIRGDSLWSDGTRIVRPLLTVRRADTLGCCEELNLDPWHDPHNREHRFARVRVRELLLPMLEEQLGPGVAENLAKTAQIAAADNDALDHMAEEALTELAGLTAGNADGTAKPVTSQQPLAAPRLKTRDVGKLPRAVATRVIARWLRGAGAAPSSVQIEQVLALVTDYHGQGGVAVSRSKRAGTGEPRDVRLVVERKDGTLKLVMDLNCGA